MANVDISEILNYFNKASTLNVLVIGEAVIDEYIYGEVIGKSNKSPSLVFAPQWQESFAGVPMNVANHLSTFCNKVHLMLMVGNDNKEDFIRMHLNTNIDLSFYKWDAPTITKRRYIASYNNGKVFEVYDFKESLFTDEGNLSIDLSRDLIKYDLVIVCDSGHGMFTNSIREIVKGGARFLAVNTQMNAGNIGTHSVRKYLDRKDRIYVCVNEREFRLATHEIWDKYKGMDQVLEAISSGVIAITTGPKGCKLCENSRIVTVPALVDNVIDPVGAGDAFLAFSSPLVVLDAPLELIGFVGNAAGGLKTTYQGNKEYITKERLLKFIRERL